jgi:shikimate kinase/3-dehydroquinate synthase
MGSGKSSVARVLAGQLGVRSFDLDEVIEGATGSSVAELFRARGEPAFRELERATLRALLSEHEQAVFALGGGTVTDTELRRELLGLGLLVSLRADVAELARRVGAGEGRPLIAGQDVPARLATLLAARAAAYAECHGEVESTGRSVQQVASDVCGLLARAPIVVPLGERSYRVEVGHGARGQVAAELTRIAPSARVVLVTDQNVLGPWATPIAAQLEQAGMRVHSVVLPAGEEHKSLRSVERIWSEALAFGVDRGSAVLSVGGGVVGDLAGFAASTLLRGVPVGHVPTTLLAMVDSAVGGKTGFDTEHGKNLIGAFHQPSFVLCDVDVLSTLPVAERRAGLAEVVKSAWIESESAVRALERDRAALAAGEPEALQRAIRMSVTLKARIVTADEREGGLRAVLNLGHTVGHAIEVAAGYRGLRHGEAVALGMVAACGVAEHLGGAPGQRARMVELLAGLGLPTEVGTHLDSRVLSFVGSDKKRRADTIRYVVPREPGRVELHDIELPRLPGLLGLPT